MRKAANRVLDENGRLVDFPVEKLKEAIDSQKISDEAKADHLGSLDEEEQTLKNAPKQKPTYFESLKKEKEEKIKESIKK